MSPGKLLCQQHPLCVLVSCSGLSGHSSQTTFLRPHSPLAELPPTSATRIALSQKGEKLKRVPHAQEVIWIIASFLSILLVRLYYYILWRQLLLSL